MSHFGVLPLLVVLALLLPAVADKTPMQLQQYFLQSCAALSQTENTCNEGWEGFMLSFASKDPMTMKVGDYDPYYRVFPIPTVITNQVLLWSRAKDFKALLAKPEQANMMCSSTLIPSAIVNYMEDNYNVTTWCGRLNEGIDYTSDCPGFEVGAPVFTFWAQFSDELGRSTSGVAFYLTPGHYSTLSFFTTHELPQLLLANSSSTKLVVLNVVQPEQTQCGEGALLDLEDRVMNERSELMFSCYNVLGNTSDPSQDLLDRLTSIIRGEQAMASQTPPLKGKSSSHWSTIVVSQSDNIMAG